MPSIRETIRNFIDSRGEPPLARDIIAHLASVGFKRKHGNIAAMVNDGSLTVTGEPCHYRYSVGHRPVAKADSGSEKRRQYEIARNERKRAARAAAGVPARGPRQQPKVRPLNYVAPRDSVGGETVDEFVARGGRVEVLPGIQRSSVFAQRRPVMGSGIRVAQ